MAKILIVDDDMALSKMLSDWLQREQHMVDLVHTGTDGLDRLRFYPYDLAVLDWQMPGMTGVEVLKAYRLNGGSSPVLMLTGMNTIDDKEMGLNSGADDFLTKPFEIREFGARVKSLLRRPSTYVPVRDSSSAIALDASDFCLIRDGERIKLLPKEFALMEFLMRHPNQFFSPEQLLNHVWSNESNASIDALRTCIKRIRQRIDRDGDRSMIHSSRGYGYKFEVPISDTKNDTEHHTQDHSQPRF